MRRAIVAQDPAGRRAALRRRRLRPQQHRPAGGRRRASRRRTPSSGCSGSRGCRAARSRRPWRRARSSAGAPVRRQLSATTTSGTLSRDSLIEAGVDVSAPPHGRRARRTSSRSSSSTRARASARCCGTGIPHLTWEPADMSARRRHVRTHAARRLPRDGRGHAGRALRARGGHARPSSTSKRCGPASRDLLQQIDAIIAAQDFPSALTGHEELGRALEAMADEFRRAARVRHARRRGQPGALRRAVRSGRRRFRWTAWTRPAPAMCFAAPLPPPACGRRTATSRTCSTTRTPSPRSTAARSGARGGLPTPAEVDELLWARPRM